MTNPHSRKALGRGLAALIPTTSPFESGVSPDSSETQSSEKGLGLKLLAIEKIKPCRQQPRKHFDPEALDELAASLKEQGLLQPLVVRQLGEDYEIVAGERRWRAASLAGMQQIPAIIKEFTDVQALQAALVENIQRADLDPLEEAETYRRLMKEHGLSQEAVAQSVGKSRSAVSNSIRLLRLPELVLNHLAQGLLTAGHARAIMTLAESSDMERLAEDVIRRKLSVRDTEAKARMMKLSAQKAAAMAQKVAPSHAERAVMERLTRALKTKVRLHHRKGRGRIEVFFQNLDELDALIARMTK